MAKSAVPVEHGYANAFYGRAMYLIDNNCKFARLAARVQSLAGQGLTLPQIKAIFAQECRSELKNLFDGFKREPDTPLVIAAPPRGDALYGRFAPSTAVLDIGSGNCNKLVKHSGVLNITCIDPELSVPRHIMKGVQGRINDNLHLLTPEVVVSSFMSLCQLDNATQARVLEYDGLHVVPDHEYLLRARIARQEGDKLIVAAPRCVYSDYRVDQPGYNIKTGYSLVSAYTQRAITIDVQDESVQQYSPVLDAHPCAFGDINLADMTYKMDGVAHELETYDGRAYLIDRAGRQRAGNTNFKHHMTLHVEELSNCFTLIRVVMYRGFVPPHSGQDLRRFVDRVNIVINGKQLCAPPNLAVWQQGMIDVQGPCVDGKRATYREKNDGIITRHLERDHYTKFQWTVDLLDSNFTTLASHVSEKGMTLEATINSGLWEYGMSRTDDVVQLVPLRERRDKLKPTAIATAMYLLSQPTIPERVALENLCAPQRN